MTLCEDMNLPADEWKNIENVEFGKVFMYRQMLHYLPFDPPDADDPTIPSPENPLVCHAKRVKGEDRLNPRGHWVRISFGTQVVVLPNAKLRP